jgi:hypothetical protein
MTRSLRPAIRLSRSAVTGGLKPMVAVAIVSGHGLHSITSVAPSGEPREEHAEKLVLLVKIESGGAKPRLNSKPALIAGGQVQRGGSEVHAAGRKKRSQEVSSFTFLAS